MKQKMLDNMKFQKGAGRRSMKPLNSVSRLDLRSDN